MRALRFQRKSDYIGPEQDWREDIGRRYEFTITLDPRDGEKAIDLLPELEEFLRTRARAHVKLRVWEENR